jgi:hypothetical protein
MAEAHVSVGVNVDVNVELERLLARAGWTPEDLGDQLNRLAASMRLRAHINRQSVRRWVHAMPSCPKIVKPSEPWPALVCHLLQRQMAALLFLSRGPHGHITRFSCSRAGSPVRRCTWYGRLTAMPPLVDGTVPSLDDFTVLGLAHFGPEED